MSLNKKLYIMVGCPGSGKSNFIKNHLHKFDGYTKVVSRDEIRFGLVNEDEEYFSKEDEVFKKFIKEIKDGLEHCENTIADATHLNESSRRKLMRALGSSLREVEINAIVIRTSLDTALAHNENRKGTRAYVPREVVRKMFTAQKLPSFDEGFNKIYIYQIDDIGTKLTVYESENK